VRDSGPNGGRCPISFSTSRPDFVAEVDDTGRSSARLGAVHARRTVDRSRSGQAAAVSRYRACRHDGRERGLRAGDQRGASEVAVPVRRRR
jgi:hypothetical protein